MDWTAEGVLLGLRRHGENAAIIEVLTAAQGRHLGVVRGGAGRRLGPVLQPGAQLHLRWQARLDAHLGHFTVEPVRARAALILHDPERLAALNAVCALAAFALPEREPQPRLYRATGALLDRIAAGESWFAAYLGWELLLLEETGFGLDLAVCAVTGTTRDLVHVSPRTGRAVSAGAAGAWKDRLLPLPPLLRDPLAPEDRSQMCQGLRTTGHFLTQVLAPALGDRPLPEARARLVGRFP